ncbi:MAG: S-layer homology domain-containing protein [Eubacteriales bacterium]|nr:S-layer homology domain-containing protein [Eubacteriales bacterium]
MKKILSLVLVIALVLGSFSFAFAATVPADVTNDDQVEAVNVLMALGIVNGYPDGTYKPERVVTRAEMTKLLVEALGYGQLAGGTAQYSDTAGHWAEGYIAIATGIGLVQGYPDGTFKPEATVSFDEMITMVVRALGYTDESLKGTWPTNYKIKAIDKGLYENTTAQSGGAQRGNVAVVLFNALFLEYGTVNADNVWVSSLEALITKLGAMKDVITVQFADVEGEDKLDSVVDLMDYLYMTVEAYTSLDGQEVFAITKVISKVLEGTVDSRSCDYIVVKSGTTLTTIAAIVGSTELLWNGTEPSIGCFHAVGEGAMVKVIHPSGSTTAQGIIAWEVTADKLIANTYKANATNIDGISLPVKTDGKVDLTKVTVVGDVDAITAIAKNDVVYAYAAQNDAKVKLEVVRDVVVGKVTEVASNNATVVLGGVSLSNPKDLTLELGDTYSVALGKDGKIYAILDTTVAAPSNYAWLNDKDTVSPTFGDDQYLVQLLTKNGLVVYELAADAQTTIDNDTAVMFELNTDGHISSLTTVAAMTANGYTPNTKVVAGAYLINDATVILDVTNNKVLTASDLGEDGMMATAVEGTSPYLDVLYVTAKGTAGTGADGTYAVITGYSLVLDGSTTVQKVTHYLDAAYPVVTLTNANGVVTSGALDVLVDVTINSAGKITAVEVQSAVMGQVTTKVGNLIRLDITGTDIHAVDANVVVYLVEDGEVVGVGSMADVVEDAYVAVYFVGEDDIQYIFVYEGVI